MSILLEEPDEEKRANALVPIREGMILDDEVEEMRCLLLDRRIEIGSIESCHDIREDPDEALIFLIPKYIIRFYFCKEIFLQFSDRRLRFAILYNVGNVFIARCLEISPVIATQGDE